MVDGTRETLPEPLVGWRALRRVAPSSGILAGAILVLALNIVFAAAIVVTNAVVPHAVLKDRVAHLVATGQISRHNFPVDFTGNKLDRYSDCMAVSTNLVGDPDRGPLELLRDTDQLGFTADGRKACEALMDMRADSGQQLPIFKYIRYWHGYQILTKPLLLFVDLTTLRTASGLLYLLALGTFFVVTATSRHGLLDGVFLATGFALLTGAENPDGVMVHNLALLAAFTGGIAMHRAALGGSYRRLFLAGIAISACIGFIDENYVAPLGAMVLTLAAISARRQAGCEDPQSLGHTFAVVLFAWACGYLGTIVLRVGVSTLLMSDPTAGIRDFIAQLMLRVHGKVLWETHGFFSPILRNGWMVVHNVMFPVVVVAAAALVATRMVAGWRFAMLGRDSSFYLLIVLIAIMPFLWYMMFRNYTVIHAYFMYRWAAFSVICCIGGVLACLQPLKVEAGDQQARQG